jgi:hypothetical protein
VDGDPQVRGHAYQRPGNSPPPPPAGRLRRATRTLGALSAGLGLAEVLAPRRVAAGAGLARSRATTTLLRSYGARELAVVPGLLSSRVPTGWVWARVAGDALDLSTLGVALARGRRGVRTMAATATVAAITAADVLTAITATGAGRPRRDEISPPAGDLTLASTR